MKMRFKQFLTEDNLTFNFDRSLDHIARDCMHFLVLSDDKPLYRGIPTRRVMSDGTILAHDLKQVHFTQHPINRPPRDATAGFTFMFNAMADTVFKIDKIRSKSIFGVGNVRVAEDFGALHFMFPAGQFSYLWSPVIKDSYDSNQKFFEKFREHISVNYELHGIMASTVMRIFHDLAEKVPDVHKWIIDADDKSENLDIEIIKGVNPTLAADIERRQDENYFSVHDAILDALHEIGHKFYEQNKNFGEAVKAGKEIMIYESEGYYSVPLDLAQKSLGLGSYASPGEVYQELLARIKELRKR